MRLMSHGHEVDFVSLDGETANAVAATMQALAAPSRVRILSRLAAEPCSVTQLAAEVEMGQPAVSQQLRVLRYLGLVVGTREGRRIVYSLHDDHVRALLAEAISHTEHIRLASGAHRQLKAVDA
jgi:ArsR family transcriptional regulator, nickel/cobalt-responsive transcriptional repressor